MGALPSKFCARSVAAFCAMSSCTDRQIWRAAPTRGKSDNPTTRSPGYAESTGQGSVAFTR